MRTSDTFGNSCRTVRRGFRKRLFTPESPAGFTLLELIVVLLILGLVTAVAVPNINQLYTSITSATERDYILDQFVGIGQKAMLHGQSYVVLGTFDVPNADAPRPDSQVYQLDVPDGWQVRLKEPLIVRANGVCLGGELTLIRIGSEPFRISLKPPYCNVGDHVGD